MALIEIPDELLIQLKELASQAELEKKDHITAWPVITTIEKSPAGRPFFITIKAAEDEMQKSPHRYNKKSYPYVNYVGPGSDLKPLFDLFDILNGKKTNYKSE